MKLPERKSETFTTGSGVVHRNIEAEIWNACLDEVAKLNPPKPSDALPEYAVTLLKNLLDEWDEYRRSLK